MSFREDVIRLDFKCNSGSKNKIIDDFSEVNVKNLLDKYNI